MRGLAWNAWYARAFAVIYVAQFAWMGIWCFSPSTPGGPHATQDPQLQFEVPLVDLGTNNCGDSVSRRVRLINSGPTTCRIERVLTTCGCMNVQSLNGSLLEPGEGVELEVGIKVPLRAGVMTHGVMIKYSTNGEMQPEMTLLLTGTVDCSDSRIAELQEQEAQTPMAPFPDAAFASGPQP